MVREVAGSEKERRRDRRENRKGGKWNKNEKLLLVPKNCCWIRL